MYKHYTLEYKKIHPTDAAGMGMAKNRTMKRVARTAELIDSADNNKRNDWKQPVPNSTQTTTRKKMKEFIEKNEHREMTTKIPMNGPNTAAPTDCVQ